MRSTGKPILVFRPQAARISSRNFSLGLYAPYSPDSCIEFFRKSVAPDPTNGRITQTPENSAVGIRVAPVQTILVVQMNQRFQGVFRRARPLQDFLLPKASASNCESTPRERAASAQRSGAQRRSSHFPFVDRLEILPLVTRMFAQRLFRPIGQWVVIVISVGEEM
jgi:hypothetical protein